MLTAVVFSFRFIADIVLTSIMSPFLRKELKDWRVNESPGVTQFAIFTACEWQCHSRTVCVGYAQAKPP